MEMKITLSKTVSRTYNLWDYENYKPSITYTVEYDENEQVNVQEELKRIGKVLDEELMSERRKCGK